MGMLLLEANPRALCSDPLTPLVANKEQHEKDLVSIVSIQVAELQYTGV